MQIIYNNPEDRMIDDAADELEDAMNDIFENDGSDIDLIGDIPDEDTNACCHNINHVDNKYDTFRKYTGPYNYHDENDDDNYEDDHDDEKDNDLFVNTYGYYSQDDEDDHEEDDDDEDDHEEDEDDDDDDLETIELY